MSDRFVEVASIDYPIIDADAHVYEPPGVWQERVPARWQARAPRVSRGDEGDVWLFDDGERVRPVGLMAAAGASYLDFRPAGLTYDGIRPGHFEPAAQFNIPIQHHRIGQIVDAQPDDKAPVERLAVDKI